MRWLDRRRRQLGLRLQNLRPRFRGYIDKFRDNTLYGWAAPTRGRSALLRVGIFVPGGLIAQGYANIYRRDLADAGIGTGHHGFAIALDDFQLREIARAGGLVSVRILGRHGGELGRLTLPVAEPEDTVPGTLDDASKKDPLAQLLFGDLARLAEPPHDADRGSGDFVAPPLARHGPLFDRIDRVEGGYLPQPLSAYADHVRYRYRIDRAFEPKRDPAEAAAFARWYLAGYSVLRRGLRVPMSRDMIAWFNEPMGIPGGRHLLTRATWAFLVETPALISSIDFDDEAWITRVIYWWSVVKARALNVEDCLVPEGYIAHMSDVPADLADDRFAPSRFLLLLRDEEPALAHLDLTKTKDLKTLALAGLTMAAGRPDLLRCIPHQTRKALLHEAGSGRSSAFAQFVEKHLDRPAKADAGAALARLAERQGIDPETGAFRTLTPDGHRVEAARFARPAGPRADVQIIGPFEKSSGLGQATRLAAEALITASGDRLDINCVDFDLDNPAPEGFSSRVGHGDYRPARVNLLLLNGEMIPAAFAYQPDVFSNAYNIGFFFWELDSPAACHHLALDMLDELWVASDHGLAVYRPHTAIPVWKAGMCVGDMPEFDAGEARKALRRTLSIPDDTFVLLTAFDCFSFVQRKNPLGTLRAFQRAFAGRDDVRLVIKTHNRREVSDPQQCAIWDEVDRIVSRDRRIVVIDETLQYDALLKLKKGADAFVSLHRAEGWGFGMIEAMALGVPVVATAYSGNLEFCSDETAWLVDYTEVEPGPDDYIFVRPGQKWAEPDIGHAARILTELMENPGLRARRAEAARRLVRTRFTPGAVGARYRARLEEILDRLDAEGVRTGLGMQEEAR